MKRRRILQVGISLGSFLIILGVILFGIVNSTEDERNTIAVKLDGTGDGTTEHNVSFEALALLPGESCEYVLNFSAKEASTYRVLLDYYEKEENEGHILKNFAYIRIESGDTVICDDLMASVFDAEPFLLPVDVNTGENTEIRLIYYLPLDVGNEAQNAEAFFGLKVNASNENEGGIS